MKILTGIVVSDKADKTIIVLVETRMTHPIYKKQFTRSRRIAAHDENNTAKQGDKVTIVETRPISATKRFKLESVVSKAAIKHIEKTVLVVEKPKRSTVAPKAASGKVEEEA